MNTVVRVDDTVRRPAASSFVRDLLRHFASRGWSGAPRYLGVDARGRDVLTFIDGDVPVAEGDRPAA